MDASELPSRISDLWQIHPTDREKAIKLLNKIFNKILSNPSQQKYGDLNFHKTRGKFEKSRPGFYLLYAAGFKQSMDGTRLQWQYNTDNYNLLTKANNALQQKIKEPNTQLQKKEIVSKPKETQSSKYRKQIQQRLKKEKSEKERQRQLIKEKIAASRKEQKIEQKILVKKIKENKVKKKEDVQTFIKEQISLEMNEMIKQFTNSQTKGHETVIFDQTDNGNQQKLKEIVAEMENQQLTFDGNNISEYLLGANDDIDTDVTQPEPEAEKKQSQFDETVVANLVQLEIATREQCIKASGIADDYKDANSVFEALELILNNETIETDNDQATYGGHNISTCKSLKNLSHILGSYYKEIGDIENKSNQTYEKYDTALILEDFHHLLEFHQDEFEDVYNKLVKECHSGAICELSNCMIMRRNHRDRTALSSNDGELKELYNNCDNINDIAKQQMLDKIHCHVFHSFDIGYKLTRNERIKIRQTVTNDEIKTDANDIPVHDSLVTAINEIVHKQKQLCCGVKGIDRLNSENTKFSSVIEEQKDSNKVRYSFGIRFFYWDYYKNNNAIVDLSRVTSMIEPFPANDEYTLAEFYVAPKFRNLKQELINNPIESMSPKQFDIDLKKAESHLETFQFKEKKVLVKYSDRFYNLAKHTPLSVQHLMAVLVYCNQDILQRKFSETYRRLDVNESNVSIVERHSNYCHLGRLLRECVECFGERNWDIFLHGSVYHGMSIQTTFSSMDACIKGPCSTSKEFIVAVSFCSNTGIIMEVRCDSLWAANGSRHHGCMFQCEFVSDFVNEREVLFIGGFSKFVFQTIIRAPYGENYKHYVFALKAISDVCIAGFKTLFMIKKLILNGMQQQLCYRIVSHQLHLQYPDNKQYKELKSMPEYARTLVKRHFAGISKYWVHNTITSGDDSVREKTFLQKMFEYLFFYDYGWLKLDLLTNVFPSLQQITLDNSDVAFIGNKSIYSSILAFLQNSKDVQLQYIRIHVTEEDVVQKAKEIVEEFEPRFREYGWLMYIHYIDTKPSELRLETLYNAMFISNFMM